MAYRVEVTSSAARDMNQIPPRYLHAIVQFLYGALAENPRRVGGELRNELAGSHSARRGAYRVLYTILDDDDVVLVHRIDHRATAYHPRRG